MTISLALLITATVMCGLGWAMIAYSGYATLRGWRIGAWYAADFSWLQGIAYLAIIGGLVFGYLAFGWWALIIVLVVGNILTRILLAAARENTQMVAPLAVLLFGIACVVLWMLQPGGS